jgi:hypothetical protein
MPANAVVAAAAWYNALLSNDLAIFYLHSLTCVMVPTMMFLIDDEISFFQVSLIFCFCIAKLVKGSSITISSLKDGR